MKFIVTAQASLEYEIEAEDGEQALEKAVELFADGWDENVLELFDWEALPKEVEDEKGV